MDDFLNVDVELAFSKFELRDLISGRVKIMAEIDKLGPNGAPAVDVENRYDALLDRFTKLD